MSNYRTGKCLLAPTMSSEVDGNADDYAQFSRMLNPGNEEHSVTRSNSPAFEETSRQEEKYDEFSQLLGLENRKYKNDEGRKTVAEAKERNTEIDPRDYDVFNSLLERTGGRGRKPVKGSRRYVTQQQAFQNLKGQDNHDEQCDLEEPPSFEGKSNAETDASLRRPRYLSEEETAEAYAIMMEEFGEGLHGSVREAEKRTERPVMHVETPTLLEPPVRPSTANAMSTRSSSAEILSGDEVVMPRLSSPMGSRAHALRPKPTVPEPRSPSGIPQASGRNSDECSEVAPFAIAPQPPQTPELRPKPSPATVNSTREENKASIGHALDNGSTGTCDDAGETELGGEKKVSGAPELVTAAEHASPDPPVLQAPPRRSDAALQASDGGPPPKDFQILSPDVRGERVRTPTAIRNEGREEYRSWHSGPRPHPHPATHFLRGRRMSRLRTAEWGNLETEVLLNPKVVYETQ